MTDFIEIRGTIDAQQTPFDRRKPIIVKVALLNNQDNRISLAMMGEGVTIKAVQADIEAGGDISQLSVEDAITEAEGMER